MQRPQEQQSSGYPSTKRVRGQPPVRPARPEPPTAQHPALRQLPQQQQQEYHHYHQQQQQQRYHQSAYNAWYENNNYDDFYNRDYGTWPLQDQSSRGQQRRGFAQDDNERSRQRSQYQQGFQEQSRQRDSQRQYNAPPPTQPHHGSGQWAGDGYIQPQPVYQDTHNFSPSVAQQQAQGRSNQRLPLGPPPSARRGPASYYPHIAPVHPIVEESESARGSYRDGPHSSYASSNAIPIGVPQTYLRHGLHGSFSTSQRSEIVSASDYGDVAPHSYEPQYRDSVEQPRETDEDNIRHEPSPEPVAVVRQASLGKRSIPNLTTVRSAEGIRNDNSSSDSGRPSLSSQHGGSGVPKLLEPVDAKNSNRAAQTSQDAQALASSTRDEYFDHQRYKSNALVDSPHSNGSRRSQWSGPEEKAVQDALIASRRPAMHLSAKDSSDSFHRNHSSEALAGAADETSPVDSERDRSIARKSSKELLGYNLPKPQQARTRARSPLAPHDPREDDIRKSLEAGGALEMVESPSEAFKPPTSGLSGRVGKQRPAALDMERVRDAEARGSLTSLPDLIKRNMRLASNLDRGKTASRFGLDWFTSDGNRSNPRKSGGSLSDILSNFPAPGLQASPGAKDLRSSFTSFSKANVRHSALPSNSDMGDDRKKTGRRCCGMRLWLFVVMVIVIFLLVVAAVVVPVMLLVVLPNMNDGSSAPGSSCQTQLNCQNGGTGIFGEDGNCRCLCVNGYTGESCTEASAAACTTTTVGTITNATVGDAIPALLEDANSNFGIPLDGPTLLGLFSSNNIGCNTQNSLVTFNGNSARRWLNDLRSIPRESFAKRETPTTENPASQATSNGIIYQTGSPASTSKSDSSATASAESTQPSSSSTTTNPASSTDFARAAVLYVFQTSGELSSASSAQSNFQDYFSNTGQSGSSGDQDADPSNLDLGNGISCNLNDFSLTLANGTAVGRGL